MSPENEKDRPATVFGVQDQDQMVAKIDAVADDDLSSTFFVDSIAEVEGAATRVFDIGIRTITTDEAPAVAGAFASAPHDSGTSAPAARPTEPTTSPRLQDDEAARRAFILGGPAALA